MPTALATPNNCLEGEIDSSGTGSFDEDLSWILQRLTERAGGQFGIFLRVIDGEREALVLACHDPDAGLDDTAVASIGRCLRLPLAQERTASDAALHRHQLTLEKHGAAIRMIYMRFPLAAGACFVAVVGAPAASMSLLQDLVARRLHPVLQRYLRLWWMHRTELRRADALAAAANRSDFALMLLDCRAHLNFANTAAEKLFAEGDGLRRNGPSISSAHLSDALRLQAVFQHALHCNAVGLPLSHYHAPVVKLKRSNRRPLLLLAAPLQRIGMDPCDPVVVVHALDPEAHTPQQLAPIFRVYELTAAEARLVTQLVGGLSLTEAAQVLKVAVPTARGYLKRVFLKTETKRQAELVRLMMASAVRSKLTLDLGLL